MVMFLSENAGADSRMRAAGYSLSGSRGLPLNSGKRSVSIARPPPTLSSQRSFHSSQIHYDNERTRTTGSRGYRDYSLQQSSGQFQGDGLSSNMRRYKGNVSSSSLDGLSSRVRSQSMHRSFSNDRTVLYEGVPLDTSAGHKISASECPYDNQVRSLANRFERMSNQHNGVSSSTYPKRVHYSGPTHQSSYGSGLATSADRSRFSSLHYYTPSLSRSISKDRINILDHPFRSQKDWLESKDYSSDQLFPSYSERYYNSPYYQSPATSSIKILAPSASVPDVPSVRASMATGEPCSSSEDEADNRIEPLNRFVRSKASAGSPVISSSLKRPLQKQKSSEVPSVAMVNGYSDLNGHDTVSRLSSGGCSQSSQRAAKTKGLTGLRNLGNTCLSNTQPLQQYCVQTDFTADLNHTKGKMKGVLMKSFCELLLDLWTKDAGCVNPDRFKNQIQKFAPRFGGYSQHDAQEFLRYLLQGLHEDLNRAREKASPKVVITEDSSLSDNQKAANLWKAYLSLDDSKIVDLFVGQLKSELRCTSCDHVSVTFDPFWDLSLPLPTHKSTCSLYECLDMFGQEEVLDGNERPTCESCKTRRKCVKRFSIQKFPSILVLHLKRFSGERYRTRLSTLVKFPLTGLDMQNFAAPKCTSSPQYNLYAVSNHSGTPSCGHYTAFCKQPQTGQWYLFDDTRCFASVGSISVDVVGLQFLPRDVSVLVSVANEEAVVSSEAYVLFYESASSVSRL